jgi:hypothetical protein
MSDFTGQKNLVQTLASLQAYHQTFLLPTIGGDPDPLMHLVGQKSLGVDFHSPKKLVGTQTHGLPPCAKVRAYEVDAYPACPPDWMRGNGRDRSYFVPVEADRGLWLDFNRVANHKKHVAVLISIQGLNPVTGRPAGLTLEQHDKDCPIHAHAFEGGRFCKECGFAWPKQNYVCTTGQSRGQMWLDGFRGADGTVRQYYFTPETAKGVATQLLGAKRVFSLGVAFFLSKTDKPPEPVSPLRHFGSYYGSSPSYGGLLGSNNFNTDMDSVGESKWLGICSSGPTKSGGSKTTNVSNVSEAYLMASKAVSRSMKIGSSLPSNAVSYSADSIPHLSSGDLGACNLMPPDGAECDRGSLDEGAVDLSWQKSKLEIAAGEKIAQEIGDDPEGLDFWEPEPVGSIFINYCPSELVDEILKKGARATQADGFLQNLKVGA